MALSEHEQLIFDEIERGLLTRTEPAPLPRPVRNLIRVVIALVALVIGVTLLRSEAAGLTLLIGFGLLGVIAYLHRYDLRHPA